MRPKDMPVQETGLVQKEKSLSAACHWQGSGPSLQREAG